MGVMSKLLESHQAQPAVSPPPAAERSNTDTERSNTWPAPAPCPACGSAAFWFDVYGGGPHCRGCNAPSSRSLVKGTAWVIGEPPRFEWTDNPRSERQGDRTGSRDDADVGTDDAWAEWQIKPGLAALALRERVDHTRVAARVQDGVAEIPMAMAGINSEVGKMIETRRYDPPLACGPVGDLTFDEWWDRLPAPPG